MPAQSLYKSWEIRRKLLDAPSPSLDPLLCKEQRELLQTLLKKNQHAEAARADARFPAPEEPATAPKKRFTLNIRRSLTLLREKLDWGATQRLEPIIQDIAQINPQGELWAQRNGQVAPAPVKTEAQPKQKSRKSRGALATVLRADVGLVLRQAVAQAMARAPELLFTDIGKVPGEFPKLAGGYVRSMWNVLSHSDPRDTVDYMVEELEEHNTEMREAPASSSGERLKVDSAAGGSRMFVDRRAMLIHHAVGTGEPDRDVTLAVHRVLHPEPRVRKAWSEPLPILDTLWEELRGIDPGEAIDSFGQRMIERNGQAMDGYAARLDHRFFISDDVVKTFYVNLVYVSKALRLLRNHGVGVNTKNGGSERDWLSGAEADSREQLHDQIAEILNDPTLREKALHHFRLELADGSTAVRYTAIAMIARLGTLDDIGLLLDLAILLPHGPGNRQESRMLLAAARRLAEL